MVIPPPCLPKVMPDWRGQRTSSSGALGMDAKEKWRGRLRSFLQVAAKRKKGLPKLTQERLANKYHLQGVDNSLAAGAGLSLKHFVADPPVRALREEEARFWVDASDLPPGLRKLCQGREMRSCIDFGEDTRLEVMWGNDRPVLLTFQDQGSIGWPSMAYLFTHGGLRGWFFPDPCHRRYDNFLNAVSAAQISFIKHEVTLIVSVGTAPWGGCGHFGKYSEAAMEYFQNYSIADPLFQAALPYLLHDSFRGKQQPGMDTAESLRSLWHSGAACKLFAHKGSKSQLNRWFQWTRRWREFCDDSAWLLLVILYIGIHLSWWPDLESSPLMRTVEGRAASSGAGGSHVNDGLDDEPGVELEGDLGARGPGRAAAPASGFFGPGKGVAGSNKDVDKWVGNKNALCLVAESLANLTTRALATSVSAIARPVEEESGLTITMMKSQRGCMEWFVKMSTGNIAYLDECMRVLADPDVLLRMGIASAVNNPILELKLDDSERVMTSLLSCERALVASELLFCMTYSHLLPGAFAGLLSPDSNVVQRTLGFCKLAWSTLVVAEEQATNDKELAGFIDQLQWPRGVWIREILIGLAEAPGGQGPFQLFAATSQDSDLCAGAVRPDLRGASG